MSERLGRHYKAPYMLIKELIFGLADIAVTVRRALKDFQDKSSHFRDS